MADVPKPVSLPKVEARVGNRALILTPLGEVVINADTFWGTVREKQAVWCRLSRQAWLTETAHFLKNVLITLF